MDTEQKRLEARAARHGALADPVRLQIVDLLALSDASPAELEGVLGIRSNLLAHHLNHLDSVGLISRRRSEADRRRTYVHLETAAFDYLDPRPRAYAPRVVFVCTGNSARSQLAAALWSARSEVPVASAGTHPADAIATGAIAAANRHGVALAAVRPQDLQDVLRDGDLVVTVCDSAHEELRTNDSLHWSIPDPVPVGTDEAFDAAFTSLADRVGYLAPHVHLAT